MKLRQALLGIGLTIACAAAVFLSSPSSWALLNMFWGAQPGATILADGTAVDSTIGPKSPWPDWALRPDGAKVTVQSSSVDSNGIASGHAVFRSPERAAEIQRAFARKLESDGWEARLYAVAVTPPEIAPRGGRICVVDGTKGALSLRASVDEWTNRPTRGAIFWRTLPAAPLIGAVDGPC